MKPLIHPGGIERWDEAMPLGNGRLGVLAWGSGSELRLSLDCADLWDLCVCGLVGGEQWSWKHLRERVAAGDERGACDLYERIYALPYPTKLPAGRVVFHLVHPEHDLPAQIERFELDRSTGQASAHCVGGGVVRIHLEEGVGVVRLEFENVRGRAELMPPRFGGELADLTAPLAADDLRRLGYPPPQIGRSELSHWFIQRCGEPGASTFAVCAASAADGKSAAIALARGGDCDSALSACRAAAQSALIRPTSDGGSQQWWRRFWSVSSVRLPDPQMQELYEAAMYLYGAGCRASVPPLPLQGLWTADDGRLPPWKGDYHHDLNTQLTYWPYLPAGHWEAGEAFLEFMWSLVPRHQEFAREYFGHDGIAVPGVMSLDGRSMGGWPQYSMSPTNGAWVAHHFYLHWKYTADETFLRRRAYPYCAGVAELLHALLERRADGRWELPLSSSPEINNGRLDAFFLSNTNYDVALMRWLFGACDEMARAMDDAAATRWRDALEGLPGLAEGPLVPGDPWFEGRALYVAPGRPLHESHRHLSHLLAIYPLGLISPEGDARDLIDGSLHQLDLLGTGQWCGYSFAWHACMAARAGKAERALHSLRRYWRAFVAGNGFHLNGDYRDLGESIFKYRPFTLEGTFAAAHAVHEMLLQSWGGVVRIFPAVSAQWKDIAFESLRAEGGWKVWADRRAGATRLVRIEATAGGMLRLRDPFAGGPCQWIGADPQRDGADWLVGLNPGQCLEGRVD